MRRAAAFPAASSVGVARSPRVGVPSIPRVVSGGWWVCAGVTRTASDACFVLTGTPQRVSLIGLRRKGCSGCVHSVDVEEVGRPSPLLAEVQFVDCVISARFSLGEKFKSRRGQLQLLRVTLTFPPVKQRPMTEVQDGGTKTASTSYTLLRLPHNTLFLHLSTSKQA